jgi:hypothetical protein
LRRNTILVLIKTVNSGLVDDQKHYGHLWNTWKTGKYDISKPAPIVEWQQINVKNITTNDLLHMNSGLEWEENYSTICDATTMLFQSGNMGRIQLEKTAVLLHLTLIGTIPLGRLTYCPIF